MSLIEYIYIDKSRIDGYFEQISDPVRYDKVPVWNASLGLTGPRAEASQTRQGQIIYCPRENPKTPTSFTPKQATCNRKIAIIDS